MGYSLNGEFPCTGCSLCCANVSNLHAGALAHPKNSILHRAAAAFPYSWGEDGACSMLKEGKCSVYSHRPLLCNIKEIAQEIALESGKTKEQLYALNATACNFLISSHGLDPRFMIDPGQFN